MMWRHAHVGHEEELVVEREGRQASNASVCWCLLLIGEESAESSRPQVELSGLSWLSWLSWLRSRAAPARARRKRKKWSRLSSVGLLDAATGVSRTRVKGSD